MSETDANSNCLQTLSTLIPTVSFPL